MVKRINKRKPAASNDNLKVTIIVFVLFLAAIFFLVRSTPKEAARPQHVPVHKAIKIPSKPAVVLETRKHEPVSVQTALLHPVEPQPVGSLPVESLPVKRMPAGSGGKIAIIIDDWGQSVSNCKYLKDIPEPLQVSILPGLRHTKDVAKCAGLYHKMTMLHLPMEAMNNNDFYPSDYVIKTTMKAALVEKILNDDLEQLPSIAGVNNHMGSKATADRPLMKLVFRRLKNKGLFFVDSMTARNSVCSKLADEMGLAFGKRDVFLDNINTREAIIKQIMSLAQRTRHKGYAVAIGHDRHLTMQVLEEQIPWLESQGFQIVSIKDLLKKR
jgi:polysaccharide deacetylase 2 family uncharacterized protein YibQ